MTTLVDAFCGNINDGSIIMKVRGSDLMSVLSWINSGTSYDFFRSGLQCSHVYQQP